MDWWLHFHWYSSIYAILLQYSKVTRLKKKNLPLAANEMKAWACFLILLTSVCCLLMGKRTNKCSRKSNGVTDDIFHFNLFNTINSHCCKEKKKKKYWKFSHWNWIMGHLSGKQFTNKSNKHAFYWFLNWKRLKCLPP